MMSGINMPDQYVRITSQINMSNDVTNYVSH